MPDVDLEFHTHAYIPQVHVPHTHVHKHVHHTHQKLEIVMRSIKEGIGKFMSPHKCSRVFAGNTGQMLLTLVLTD